MSADLSSVLRNLPKATAGEAAASVGRVLEALRDSFPVGDERDLFLTLVSERVQALRCRSVAGSAWVYFSHLLAGECFVDAQGRAMRKTEPLEQHGSDGSFAPPFVAVDLHTGEPVFVRANARVERIDRPADLT